MAVEGNPTIGWVVGTGAFTATGNGEAVPVARRGDLNISLSGTFVATVVPQRSFDGGTTWLPLTYVDGTAISWTAPMSTPLPCSELGAQWRLACTWTSGTVNWRISQ
jgi:hypothetical protein